MMLNTFKDYINKRTILTICEYSDLNVQFFCVTSINIHQTPVHHLGFSVSLDTLMQSDVIGYSYNRYPNLDGLSNDNDLKITDFLVKEPGKPYAASTMVRILTLLEIMHLLDSLQKIEGIKDRKIIVEKFFND